MDYLGIKSTDEKPLTLNNFMGRYLVHASADCCKDTIRNKKGVLDEFIKFIGDVGMHKVNAERADAWKIYLINKYKPNTVRFKISTISLAFKYATAIEVIDRNPFAYVTLPKSTFSGRVLSDKAIRSFFGALPLLVRRILILALNTGMRRKEAVMLDWSEVQEDKVVLPPERTKNRKGRTIYLNSAALKSLGTRKGSFGRVFPISISYTNEIVTRTWRKLNLGRIRIHDLRHTAATRHYERNKDDYAMMMTFGWSNPNSTKPYHHVSDERIKKSMERLTYAI